MVWYKKIALRVARSILGKDKYLITKEREGDGKELADFIYSLHRSRGYALYHTGRKYDTLNALAYGMKQEDYWKMIGRMEELMILKTKIKEEVERRKKK